MVQSVCELHRPLQGAAEDLGRCQRAEYRCDRGGYFPPARTINHVRNGSSTLPSSYTSTRYLGPLSSDSARAGTRVRTADGGSASNGARVRFWRRRSIREDGPDLVVPAPRDQFDFQRDVACQAIAIRSYGSVAAIEVGDGTRFDRPTREDQRMNGDSTNTKLTVAATPVSPITRMT